MILRHRTASCLIAWMLTITLIAVPLMAQDSPTAGPSERDETVSTTPQPVPVENATSVIGESDTPDGTPVLATLAVARPLPKYPAIPRTAIALSGSAAAPKPAVDEPTGESKWIILAAIVGTAAAVGIILLLRGFGGGKSTPSAGPVGTILTPGTPAVNAPNR